MYPPPTTSSVFGMSGRSSAAGRVHHARIVHLQRRRNRRRRAGREDAVLEGERLLGRRPTSLHAAASVASTIERIALDVVHLARLARAGRCRGQPLDDVVLELSELVEIDLRLARTRRPTPSRGATRRSAWRRGAGPSTGCSHDRRRRRRDSVRYQQGRRSGRGPQHRTQPRTRPVRRPLRRVELRS